MQKGIDIMIENGFIFAVNKSLERERKLQERKRKKDIQFYSILSKYDVYLEDLKKEYLTKKELDFMVKYIINELKYPIRFYPNLI